MTIVVDAESRVNTNVANAQFGPQVTALADGGWVTTWESADQDGMYGGIYQQAYNADGSARNGEVRVNTTVSGDQQFPMTAALADGGWVTTWQSTDSTVGSGIFTAGF